MIDEFVDSIPIRCTTMIIRSLKLEVKILIDRDVVITSFEKWARPNHFSRTIE